MPEDWTNGRKPICEMCGHRRATRNVTYGRILMCERCHDDWLTGKGRWREPRAAQGKAAVAK